MMSRLQIFNIVIPFEEKNTVCQFGRFGYHWKYGNRTAIGPKSADSLVQTCLQNNIPSFQICQQNAKFIWETNTSSWKTTLFSPFYLWGLLYNIVKNYEASEILPYLQANLLACVNFMGTGRNHYASLERKRTLILMVQ